MTKSRFPHPLVLIFAMIVVAQILTYELPAGQFAREPQPTKGDPYVENDEGPSLRVRLAAARTERGLSEQKLAELFDLSEATVVGWELGEPDPDGEWHAGTQIEATVGALLEDWVRTGGAPSAGAIAGWKKALSGEKQRVIAGTYQQIEDAEPLPRAASLLSILKGMMEAADIIFFVFVVGGVIGVLRATGAIDAMIGRAIHGLGHRPILLIAGMTTLFAIGSSTIGMAEEYMPFIPILVTMCLALRMDAVVAMGIVYIGAGVEYGAAALNPFTVMIAQGIAGVEPTSGWLFRVLFMFACLAVGVHHVMRYARKVKNDPSSSYVADIDYSKGYELPDDVALTAPRIAVIVAFVSGVALFVYGVAVHDWYFAELNAVFLGMALFAAIICRLSPNRTATEFCSGAAEMTTTALLIGFARTIELVLSEGQVSDTVIHGIAGLLEGAGATVSAVGMLFVQSICNFFIPSGSGQAYVTMPIMAPLADLTGVSRQTSVLAYQVGDGFTNMIVPTNALLMGMLALGRIPYQRWMKFILPLMVKLYLLAVVVMAVAVATGF